MSDYRFFRIGHKQFGVAIKPFRWLYVHGCSNLRAGGIRIGTLEVIW